MRIKIQPIDTCPKSQLSSIGTNGPLEVKEKIYKYNYRKLELETLVSLYENYSTYV